MTKLFLLIIASLIISISGGVEDDYYTDEFIDENIDKTRVAAGTDSVQLQNLDYTRLSIVFQNNFKTCGGSLIKGLYVLTSASCVYDPFEEEAFAINISLPQNRLLGRKLDLFIHPEFNYTTKENDIAVIQMDTPITPDGRSVNFSILSTNNESGAYVGKILRFCGMGSFQNYPTFPTTLKCTELRVVPPSECGVNLSNILCTFWKDRDNNVCSGDYGGPLYEITVNGTNTIQTLVGIASFSPNARKNASCLGGHKVVFTQVGAHLNIIEEFIGASLKSFSIRGRHRT